MRRLIALVLALTLAAGALPASGSELGDFPKKQRAEIKRFAISNSLFTLYHEVGHLLIDQLRLPVLGREEDAADNMATWMMLQRNTPEANRALEDAVHGWALTGDSFGNRWNDDDYASGYSPDRQRALQIVCLIVGADGAAFRPVANFYDIHPDRQRSCHFDYDLIDRSMRNVLAESGHGTKVDVVYHDSAEYLEPAQQLLRDSGILDTVATQVRKGYRIDSTVTMTATECGEPNAFYDPATVEIIFCYELMQDFVDLYSAQIPELPATKQKGAPRPPMD